MREISIETIGGRIRHVRLAPESGKKTLDEMSDSLGITRAQLLTYELNKVVPTDAILKLISYTYNVNYHCWPGRTTSPKSFWPKPAACWTITLGRKSAKWCRPSPTACAAIPTTMHEKRARSQRPLFYCCFSEKRKPPAKVVRGKSLRYKKRLLCYNGSSSGNRGKSKGGESFMTNDNGSLTQMTSP